VSGATWGAAPWTLPDGTGLRASSSHNASRAFQALSEAEAFHLPELAAALEAVAQTMVWHLAPQVMNVMKADMAGYPMQQPGQVKD